jgi:protein-S-isoprenylcysteine O-methyltransferase Ste14
MRAVGEVLIVAGVALALRSAALLAGRGRPRRGPRPALVIAGPYRRVRNPLLGGLVVAVAGAALVARSTPLGAAAAFGAVVAHAWIVRVEEPRLAARFGDAYAAYLRRVPRWMPSPARPRDDAGEAG